jgi:putative hydrolase of the HAD superfamily
MSIQAVIFDLGGTLIDWPDWDDDIDRRWMLSYDYLCEQFPKKRWPDRELYAYCMRQAELEHWKRVTTQYISNRPEEVLLDGFQKLNRRVTKDELLAALDGFAQAVNNWAEIFPDVVPTLLTLRKQGLPLGLLSNTWWAAAWHNAELATHGLDTLLDVVIYTSDLKYSKPHPETFLTVTERLGVDPKKCVMVGDRLVDDVSGSLGVGMRGIWKKTPYPWPEPDHIKPTATITNLAEILPLIERWR